MSVKVLFHGHANLEIHHGEHRVQLDPFYTHNGLTDVKADDVNPTHILLSHAHGDHVGDCVSISKRTGASVAGILETVQVLEKQGAKVVGMNYGGTWNAEFGKATLTIAFHTSTFPDGTPGGLPAGWIIEIGGKTIYFAGDTCLFGDMKLIGELWNIDLACLPIGGHYTMGPEHAVKAAAMLKAKKVLPIHYNTFPPIKQDPQKFASLLKSETGIEAIVLLGGESLIL